MAWPAKKHSDENAHETHRIMPRRWGEVLVPTHPIFGPGRKRLPHTCICVCVCVPVRIPAHAHDCIRSQHLFPSFDTCLAELEHRVLLSIVLCSHHTESNMYACRSVFWIQPLQDDQKICAISRHTLRLDPSNAETTASLRYEIACGRCVFLHAALRCFYQISHGRTY